MLDTRFAPVIEPATGRRASLARTRDAELLRERRCTKEASGFHSGDRHRDARPRGQLPDHAGILEFAPERVELTFSA